MSSSDGLISTRGTHDDESSKFINAAGHGGLIAANVIFATFSIIGSSCIIHQGRRKLSNPYHRMLMAMSIVDIVFSLRLATTHVISQTEPNPLCTLDGFMGTWHMASPLYNASLSTYFLLVIRHGITEKTFTTRWELPLHVTSVVFPLVIAIPPIFMDLYHPNRNTEMGCWLNVYDSQDGTFRGEDSSWYTAFAIVPIVLIWIILLVNNLLIYLSFRKAERDQREKALRRYTIQASTKFPSSGAVGVDIARSSSHLTAKKLAIASSVKQKSRASKVAIQSFCYLATYLITYLLSIGLWIAETADATGHDHLNYSFVWFSDACIASQGMWNFLVYVRPRYLRWREATIGIHSRYYCFWKAAFTTEKAPVNRGYVYQSSSNRKQLRHSYGRRHQGYEDEQGGDEEEDEFDPLGETTRVKNDPHGTSNHSESSPDCQHQDVESGGDPEPSLKDKVGTDLPPQSHDPDKFEDESASS